jgi:triacylglycerol lipase
LHYYRDGRGPVVLFLHGFGGNGTNWSLQFPALRARFTVIALDQLGFGESSKPHLAYNADVLADSAIHFLDALAIKRATIVGASMGGDVAARIAAKYPRRVERLLLMDASGDGDPSDPAPPAIPVDPKTAEDQEAILRVLIYDQSRVTPELIQQRLAAHLAAGDSYTRRHFSDAPVDLSELLPRIVAPTLLIWGEHDPLVPLAAARRFRRDIA